MKAIWNGVLIAESTETIVVEGNHYFPPKSVNEQYLLASEHTTNCSWKGKAHYYSITTHGKTNVDAAWYYPEPFSAAQQIKGYLAFWRGVEIVG